MWLKENTDEGEHASVLNRPSTVVGQVLQAHCGFRVFYNPNGLLFPRLVQSHMRLRKLLASEHSLARSSTSRAFTTVFWICLWFSFLPLFFYWQRPQINCPWHTFSLCLSWVYGLCDFGNTGIISVQQTSSSQPLKQKIAVSNNVSPLTNRPLVTLDTVL